MKNIPDNRDPNKVWYLHVNGKYHSEYENLQACIVNALVHLQSLGHEIHIQTRQQWLDSVDKWEVGYDYAIDKMKLSKEENNVES